MSSHAMCLCKVTTFLQQHKRLISSNPLSSRAPESPRTNGNKEDQTGDPNQRPPPAMASECSFAHGVSLPAHRPPLAFFTSCRLRHGAVRTVANHRVVEAARPVSVGAARRMLGSARYGGHTAAPGRAEDSEVAVPASVPVRVAYEMQLAGHRYLDVRTEGEFGGGRPAGAVNIPYMYSTGSGMAKNPHFLEQVSAIFGSDDELIIGCQSGKRSLMAAAELCSAGFTAVTDIAGGFSTWRENGLPVIGR
ncbi:rhodanese-like domain-containing protein 15, chloroplastic isoform X2 [Triticum aestivum]|uniref:rhodanese-like domain-containing protein 15, chloroplastic isoform X2 n=2 Tax=Triticum aestivum TaxID=4565 RepID=UPI001D02D4E8|nr:rhodanese-like domain-containing protein 15, chloroplastic isoform X2 [Triticum aestivum]